jgi:hypothetical protein
MRPGGRLREPSEETLEYLCLGGLIVGYVVFVGLSFAYLAYWYWYLKP